MRTRLTLALVACVTLASCSSISEDVIAFAIGYAKQHGARIHVQPVSDSTSVIEIGTLHGEPIYRSLPLHDNAVKAFRGFYAQFGWDSLSLAAPH